VLALWNNDKLSVFCVRCESI